MIRWKYAVPRLLLAAAVVLLILIGLDPLVHWGLEAFCEQALSLRVEIEGLDIGLQDNELKIEKLAVADPHHGGRNLVEAESLQLALERGAFLRRKLVVRSGAIRGLAFGALRDTQAEPIDHWQLDFGGKSFEPVADKWLEVFASSMRDQIEAEIDQLESVKLAKGLLEKWPAEYEQLEAQVRAVRTRLESLRSVLEARPQNLAAGIEHYQRAMAQVQTLQQDLAELADRIDRLPNRALADRDAILAAKDRDVQALRTRFEALRLDGEALSEYLLGPEMGRRVIAIAQFVQWIRRQVPTEDDQDSGRLAGVNVLFRTARQRPEVLFESLLIDGTVDIGGQPYKFVAAAKDLTTDPKLHGRPAVIQADLVGATTVELHAVLDRTGERPVDRIVVNLPQLDLPEAELGRPDSLCFRLKPGKTHLWLGLTLGGDELSGMILVEQSGIELTPALPAPFGGDRLAESLAKATRAVDRIEVQVDLAGKLASPRLRVRSDLGAKLTDSLNQLVVDEIAYHRDLVAVLVEQRVEQELSRFQNRLIADEEVLGSRLKLSESEIQQLGKVAAQRIPSTEQILSKALGEKLRLR